MFFCFRHWGLPGTRTDTIHTNTRTRKSYVSYSYGSKGFSSADVMTVHLRHGRLPGRGVTCMVLELPRFRAYVYIYLCCSSLLGTMILRLRPMAAWWGMSPSPAISLLVSTIMTAWKRTASSGVEPRNRSETRGKASRLLSSRYGRDCGIEPCHLHLLLLAELVSTDELYAPNISPSNVGLFLFLIR